MKSFYNNLKKAFREFSSSSKTVFLVIFIDVLFLVAMSGAYTFAVEKTFDHVDAVTALMDVSFEQLAESQTQAELSMLAAQQSTFMFHYKEIMKYIAIFAFTFLLFWIIFQGVNWYLTQNSVKKTGFKDYAVKFSLSSVISWILLLLIIFFSAKMAFQAYTSLVPLAGRYFRTGVSILLFFFLFYFTYTVYAFIPRKKFLKDALKRSYRDYKVLLPAYIFISVLLTIEYLIFVKIMYFGGYAAAVFALLILFPTIAFSRFYAVIISE